VFCRALNVGGAVHVRSTILSAGAGKQSMWCSCWLDGANKWMLLLSAGEPVLFVSLGVIMEKLDAVLPQNA